MDDFGEELFVVHPFATPELAVATDNFRFEVFHTPEVDKANGAIRIKEVIAGMGIGMERLNAEKLEEKEMGQRQPDRVTERLVGMIREEIGKAFSGDRGHGQNLIAA